MKATNFPQANLLLTAPSVPEGRESDVYDLPVWRGFAGHDKTPRIISCWQPNERERAAIARGAPVWLWIMGATHPPVSLEVGSPFDTSDIEGSGITAATDDHIALIDGIIVACHALALALRKTSTLEMPDLVREALKDLRADNDVRAVVRGE